MSDEDRDVDIESDEDDEDGFASMGTQSSTSYMTPAERRAHHNALERKRRDHIKESFTSLRDSVPQLHGEKVKVSRAQILKKAADYITYMRRKNHSHQQDIDELKRHNTVLEQQIKSLEKAKSTGQFAVSGSVNSRGAGLGFDVSGSDSEETNGQVPVAKKIKLSVD
ncbi:MAX-like protein [Mya arenaria]|uniref:MAX-like protein n=1 Tax=Mya arenaria TaxID=6604 RepID=A0ABY7FHY7_MYAAR|nr:protein max-like isoform X3 [Mya arenaria]XP_052770166.1 protein max-like isoform X3 [Mya arenaria]WAR18867.1 MAX-like protein [Mya arenaria]WAR20652.1 MAX-like protein [Mya arenaria]